MEGDVPSHIKDETGDFEDKDDARLTFRPLIERIIARRVDLDLNRPR